MVMRYKLTIEPIIELNKTSPTDISENLLHLVKIALSEGLFTGCTDAEILSIDYNVETFFMEAYNGNTITDNF